MGRDELRDLRASIFNSHDVRAQTHEFRMAIVQFLHLYSMVQDMQVWRKHSEPGLAGMMIDDGETDDAELEQARWIDRQSIEMHSDIVREFEESGGKAALEAARLEANRLVRM